MRKGSHHTEESKAKIGKNPKCGFQKGNTVNSINYVGKKFGKLTIIDQYRSGSKTMALCLCDCGQYKTIIAHRVSGGYTKSCGCLKKEIFKNNPHPWVGKKHSKETRAKMSNSQKGHFVSEETRQKNSISMHEWYKYNDNPKKGMPVSEETRFKMSISAIERCKANPEAVSGENNPMWKGGISIKYAPIFRDQKYRDLLWARHGEVCMNPNCSEEHLDKPLVLHHIDHRPKNTWPENLIGICLSCNFKAESQKEWDYYIELYQGITAELNSQEATEYFNNYYTNFLDFEDPSQDDLSLLEAVNQ